MCSLFFKLFLKKNDGGGGDGGCGGDRGNGGCGGGGYGGGGGWKNLDKKIIENKTIFFFTIFKNGENNFILFSFIFETQTSFLFLFINKIKQKQKNKNKTVNKRPQSV